MMHLDLNRRTGGLWTIADDQTFSIGCAAKNCNTINYQQTIAKIRRYEKHLMSFQTGLPHDSICFLNQEHGDKIIEISSGQSDNDLFCGTADAMITERKNIMLVIRTADCVPVFIADNENSVVAAVHSGWRGTASDITGKTIAYLIEKFSSKPENLRVYILPSIGVEYYEVGKEVADNFSGCIITIDGKYFLDMKSAIIYSLKNKGVANNNIFASFYDTFRDNDSFFSHRKGDVGRNLNYIYLK